MRKSNHDIVYWIALPSSCRINERQGFFNLYNMSISPDYDRWYNNLTTKERDEFEQYCRNRMTPEEYAAYTPVAVKPKQIDPKDIQMFQALIDGHISETEWIKYKAPRNKTQMMELAKIITMQRKIKRTKKQAQWILTRIS